LKAGSSLVNPTFIELRDKVLYIIDRQNKSGQIQGFIIDENDNTEFLFSYGKEGNGPGEYFGLKKLEILDRFIYTFDISWSIVNKISLDSIIQNPDYIPVSTYLYERPKIHNFELINETTSVVGYYRENPRFRVLKNFTDTLERFHQYPPIENKYNLPETKFVGGVRGNLYQAESDYSASSDLLVLSYYNSTLIDIIDFKSRRLIKRLVGNDNNFPPDYVLMSDQRASSLKDSKAGFNEVQITENYIYALYNGKTIEKNFGDLMTGTAIYKFDLEGNPLVKYNLNPELTSFAVDEENQKIYGVNYYDNPLVVFDLP